MLVCLPWRQLHNANKKLANQIPEKEKQKKEEKESSNYKHTNSKCFGFVIS